MTEHDYLELCSDLADLIVAARHGRDYLVREENGDRRYTPAAQHTFDDAMCDVERLIKKATNYND